VADLKSYLNKRRKNRFGIRLFIGLGLFLILAAAGIFYLLVFSPYFRFDKIAVNGLKMVSEKQILDLASRSLGEKIYNHIPVNNPIFIPRQKIENEIIDLFPQIKKVSVENHLTSRQLVLNIEERQPAVIWCRALRSDWPEINATSSATSTEVIETKKPDNPKNDIRAEKCFFADNEGFVFADAPILSGGSLATVYSPADHEIKIKDIVVDKKMLDFILAVKKELVSASFNLSEFMIRSQSFNDLEIIAPEGWTIYLDAGQSPAAQAQALKRVLEEEIKDKRINLEYVDLRVQNRVYYKYK